MRVPRHTIRWPVWLGALAGLAATTLALLALRPRLEPVHVALGYLLVVLGGSAAGGRAVGLMLSGGAFLLFNFLFVPPYHTIVVADSRDWFVLVAFLVTGVVAAQLLDRAQRAAALAEARADEVDRLATLGAETLSAGRADDALTAIVQTIRTTLGVSVCDLYTADAGIVVRVAGEGTVADRILPVDAPWSETTVEALVRWVVEHRTVVREFSDGRVQTLAARWATARDPAAGTAVRALLLPLDVRGRIVGVLRLADERSVVLAPAQQRYLEALAYYAALGVERLRLVAEVERAAALREADRLKDAVLATVSHDLRTPLTTIGALAREMAREGDERALIVEEEVQRLNRFVTDLLDMSRLNAGGMPVSLAINAAEDVMGAVLQRVGGLAGTREIRASLDPQEPVLIGRFDFSQTLRILGNLVENALKYSPSDTVVDFTVHRTGERLQFVVADRGPGIAEREREQIFTPFYRPPTMPPDAGSAGLGLAIARGLAEQQGGALSYAPRSGGGSVFTLTLPAENLSALGDQPAAMG